MQLKKSAFLGLVALSSITLAACGGGSKNADGGASGEEKVFRLVERQEMPSADPSLATDEVSFVALNNVYEGIYRLDKDSKPQPAGAAEKAEVSEDGLTYKIKLREDAKWTDDKPVKAEDYVYGWQRTVDPATGSEYAYMFNSVKNAEKISKGEMKKEELGIKAVGDYELEITLEQATPFFDYLLAFPSFLPQRQDIVEKYGKDYTTDSDKAVYNGPFTLTDFDGPGTDTNWSYTKNDKYWDKDTVKLDKVTIDVVKEAPTSLNLFQDGQADDVPLSGELAQQMKSDPNFITLKAASTFYLEPNQIEENSPYRNANLRKALSYAIDRKALVDQILANGSTVPEGLVPAGLAADPKTDEDFAKESGNDIVYDVDKAKESWKKAKDELGISTLSVDLLIDDTDNAKKMAEYLQGSLSETLDGLKVSVSPVPFSVRLDRSNKGDFEIAVSAWGADYADPSSFLDLFVTGNAYNRGHYSNPEYDKLVNSAATTNANNPEARWQDLLNAEKTIMDDKGVIPLYQKAEARLRSEKIKDVVYHSTGAKYDFKWAYIEE
ncbi:MULTISPECIES: peptide ABC transporter substrate-binding protein [unclassified Enterococcus]|uniref:peptide ABC transporter substrate-binding protein n=1 Tax=unclassified Enterococcus TaxID=2608891 RepID=UPI001CE0D75E|nr:MULTISPECIES: peptide ABC transporter substrate-binding protein [unclassified Enterococcus]MCA5014485.1 peptide ABC transporter substrate-binding protein [Enterococcus sp. S23]MCA5017401.1 peptide ABC transporter substrate-binding protein [Enterococcus sp. S22(2020)]